MFPRHAWLKCVSSTEARVCTELGSKCAPGVKQRNCWVLGVLGVLGKVGRQAGRKVLLCLLVVLASLPLAAQEGK